MNYKQHSLIAILLLIISLHSYGHGKSHRPIDSISIHNPMVRITPPGITNSAGYFTLTNNSDSDITVVGARSQIAERTEIHEHTMTNGLMQMQKVDSLIIPAKTTIHFKPGGYHIMLMNINTAVTEGQKIELGLEFKHKDTRLFTAIGMNPESAHSHSNPHSTKKSSQKMHKKQQHSH